MENHHHCQKCGDMVAPNRTLCLRHSKNEEERKVGSTTDYQSYVLWKLRRPENKGKILCPDCLGKGCANCDNTGLIKDSSIPSVDDGKEKDDSS